MTSFISKLQRTPKVRSVRKKISDLKRKQKALSNEYKRAIKTESKRLSKKTKKTKKSKKTKKRR